MNCQETQRAIEGHFALTEEPFDEAAVQAHLATCATCRALWERLARVDAALSAGGLGPAREDAVEAKLLARLGVAPAPVTPAPRRRWAGVGALAAVIVAVLVTPRLFEGDGFAPRGGADEAFGVRAFCVAAQRGVIAEARAGQTLRCAEGNVIQFTYTAPRAATLVIELEGTDTRLFPPEGAAAPLAAGTDVALSTSTPVGAWLTAPKQVVARFLDADGGVAGERRIAVAP